MTLDELLALARMQLASTDPTDGYASADYLARGVISLLGKAQPCGWPEPRAEMADDNGPYVSLPGALDLVPVDEMRGLVVSILRACDAADAMKGPP